jgi:hypothetical protein
VSWLSNASAAECRKIPGQDTGVAVRKRAVSLWV